MRQRDVYDRRVEHFEGRAQHDRERESSHLLRGRGVRRGSPGLRVQLPMFSVVLQRSNRSLPYQRRARDPGPRVERTHE